MGAEEGFCNYIGNVGLLLAQSYQFIFLTETAPDKHCDIFTAFKCGPVGAVCSLLRIRLK